MDYTLVIKENFTETQHKFNSQSEALAEARKKINQHPKGYCEIYHEGKMIYWLCYSEPVATRDLTEDCDAQTIQN